MVDEQKIRLMMRLARFEAEEGKEDLRIAQYSRADYIGLGLLKNFFLTTIGYGLFVVILLAYQMDYLMENFHMMNIPAVIIKFIIGYLAFLFFYTVVTYIRRSLRYKKAKKSVEYYYAGLELLSHKFYENERQAAGGKHS